MNNLKLNKYHFPVLMLLAAFMFIYQTYAIPITDGDSTFYCKIAKNIVQTNDFTTMHYGDASTIIDKPPLMMWLVAGSYKILGVTDFAATIWHSLFAVLLVFFTYKMSKELFGPETAFVSSAILITSAQFFYQARSPLQDVPLALFTLIAVYCYLLFEKRKRSMYLFLASASTALGLLTKGPVGLALPALTIFAYILINKKKFPTIPQMLGAAGIFLAISMPWFIIEYKILGQKFLDIFVGHNLGRYFSPIDTIGNEASKFSGIKAQFDFYSYFAQILLLFVPWSGFVYPAFFYFYKKKYENLPIIFTLAVVLFFSISLNYKISRYILPAFAPISIVVGVFITDLIQKKDEYLKKLSYYAYWTNLILIAAPLLMLALYYINGPFAELQSIIMPMFLPFIGVLLMAIIFGSIAGIFQRHEMAFALTFALTIYAYVVLVDGLARNYTKLNPISSYSAVINEKAKPNDKVVQYGGTDAHFMIYYSKFPVIFIRSEDQMVKMLRSGNKVWCITEGTERFKDLNIKARGHIKKIKESSQFTLLSN